MLQSNRHKFSRTIVSPTCRICGLESEDITHMLLNCFFFLTVLLSLRPCIVSRLLGPFLSSFIKLVMSSMRKWV